MTKQSDFKAAATAVRNARHSALHKKRAAGDPRNPFLARAGQEREFQEADRNVRTCNLILGLLEKEEKRQERKRTQPARERARRFLNRILERLLVAGLAMLAVLGFAAAFLLLRQPSPAVEAAAVIGVSIAAARAFAR